MSSTFFSQPIFLILNVVFQRGILVVGVFAHDVNFFFHFGHGFDYPFVSLFDVVLNGFDGSFPLIFRHFVHLHSLRNQLVKLAAADRDPLELFPVFVGHPVFYQLHQEFVALAHRVLQNLVLDVAHYGDQCVHHHYCYEEHLKDQEKLRQGAQRARMFVVVEVTD